MLEEILEAFESTPALIISGLCLLASFFASTELPFDPAWLSVLISGSSILYWGVRRLFEGEGLSRITSALLISIAMLASISIGDLFAAGEVAFIMSLGERLEGVTVSRAKRGLEALIRLTPTTGRRLDGEIVALERIAVGDVLRVLPGETIPVDGVIVSGRTSIDQSIMTGESMPVDRTVGDGVFGGTINRYGSIDLRAESVGEDSSLRKLIRLVEAVEEHRAPIQRLADVWASRLVPLAMLIALATYGLTGDAVRAVTVLVVFCPCALVLATPTAMMAAIGQAARHGVVIKSGAALEALSKAGVMAFDKTGTLTRGELKVGDAEVFDGRLSREGLLELAAALEARSEHPLGRAIVGAAKKIPSATEFEMSAGRGVSAVLDGRRYIVGSEKFLIENAIEIDDESREKINELRRQGKAVVLIGDETKLLGAIGLSDTFRAEAPDIIGTLSSLGVRSMILTGDNHRTADHLARALGIDDVRSELLPQDKVSVIERLRAEGSIVCMVGDGVNDAPALKTADVGIAMGAMGSDIAVDAADIALMSDDLSRLPYLKRLADATRRTIMFSISLSMAINFGAIALSIEGLLTPTTGALVHNLGSCFVILIAAMLYDRNFDVRDRSVEASTSGVVGVR